MNKFLGRPRIWQVHRLYRNYGRLAQRIASWIPEEAFHESSPMPEASVPELLKNQNYLAATQQFVSSTSIGDLAADLHPKVFSHLDSEFARRQVLCSLVQLGLGDLVEESKHEFEIVLLLESAYFSVSAWDQILGQFGHHFPQVLGKGHSQWLKARLLTRVISEDPRYAEKLLQRYAHHIQDPEAVRSLLRTNYLLVLPFVARPSLVDTVLSECPKEHFKKTCRVLQPLKVYPQLLSLAIKLGQSYEVLKIYKRGRFTIGQTSKALLAAAWSQKRDPLKGDHTLTTAETVNLTIVVGILKHLPARHKRAVLYRTLKEPLPPNILWALLLACEQANITLPRQPAQLAASSLIVRPHLEQFRYMSLQTTTASSLLHLLRLNIVKANIRDREDALVAEADMKLLVGGMILLAEKQRTLKPVSEAIEDLFLAWDDKRATEFVASLFRYHKPDLEVTLTVVGILISQKCYTQAVQLLHMRRLEVPPTALHRLLLGVCRDVPKISSLLTSWLVNELKVDIPVEVLREMIINLSNQRVLSDAQSTTRINLILRLLREKKSTLGAGAAAAVVDGFLARARRRRGGSRQRLQWALDLCRDENVSQQRVKEWVGVVNKMRRSKTGYWFPSRQRRAR